MRISEVSPNTLEGSWSRDLVLSKLWLISKLKTIKRDFDTIYILGSWYGNLSLLMLDRNLRFDQIINVDVDGDALRNGADMASKLGMSDRIRPMCKDVNDLDYRNIGTDGLVINTSCNNIKGMDWFRSIPQGTMVALQSRNMDPGAIADHETLDEFIEAYQMEEMIFNGKLSLTDNESDYDRFMLIGKV